MYVINDLLISKSFMHIQENIGTFILLLQGGFFSNLRGKQ